MSDNDAGGFDTGYKRPPKHTRFRKGVSGNPKGRPKGRVNVATILDRILREKVLITENGVRKSVTKLEAAIKRLADKADGGDIVAIRLLVGLALSAGLEKDDAQTKEQSSESDRKLLNRILERMKDSGRE